MCLGFIKSRAKATEVCAYQGWAPPVKIPLGLLLTRGGAQRQGATQGARGLGATENSHEPWRAISWTHFKNEKAQQKQEMDEKSSLRMKKTEFLKATMRFRSPFSSVSPRERE